MKTQFSHGTVVTPEFLTAINTPRYAIDPQQDGELPLPPLSLMTDVSTAIDSVGVSLGQRISTLESYPMHWKYSNNMQAMACISGPSGAIHQDAVSIIKLAKLSGSIWMLDVNAEFAADTNAAGSGLFWRIFATDSYPGLHELLLGIKDAGEQKGFAALTPDSAPSVHFPFPASLIPAHYGNSNDAILIQPTGGAIPWRGVKPNLRMQALVALF